MASHLFTLNRLKVKERLAIALVRGHYSTDAGTDERAAFDRLRNDARHAGLAVFAATNPFVGEDEIKLLGWLALMQRRQPSMALRVDVRFRSEVLDCARLLHTRDIRLEFRVIARMDGCRTDQLTDASHLKSGLNRSRRSIDRLSTASSVSLQRRALLLVRDHGAAPASELDRAGVPTQVVGLMVKRGLLRRVRAGIYIAGPGAEALLGY
jgi:hypothetical protein